MGVREVDGKACSKSCVQVHERGFSLSASIEHHLWQGLLCGWAGSGTLSSSRDFALPAGALNEGFGANVLRAANHHRCPMLIPQSWSRYVWLMHGTGRHPVPQSLTIGFTPETRRTETTLCDLRDCSSGALNVDNRALASTDFEVPVLSGMTKFSYQVDRCGSRVSLNTNRSNRALACVQLSMLKRCA